MWMKNGQFCFNFSKKTNRKIQKRNSIQPGNVQAICEMQKSKKAVELVEVYVPQKFSEDSLTWMEGFVKMSVTFPIIFKRKR